MFPGRCKHRPLQGFAASPGSRFPGWPRCFPLFRRAGDFARRTSASSKNMCRRSFFENQRCGGVKTLPYNARQTLYPRETIGFFDSPKLPPCYEGGSSDCFVSCCAMSETRRRYRVPFSSVTQYFLSLDQPLFIGSFVTKFICGIPPGTCPYCSTHTSISYLLGFSNRAPNLAARLSST